MTPAFVPIAMNISIGPLFPIPHGGQFDAVLTLGVRARKVGDQLRHRHIPLIGIPPDGDQFTMASVWVFDQVMINRRVLIRDNDLEMPAAVCADVVLQCGGTFIDALTCVHSARSDLLQNPSLLDFLRGRA